MTTLRRNYLFWLRDSEGRTIIKFGNIDQSTTNSLEGPPQELIVNLRMQFDIHDTINSNANIGDISVYNMNRELLTELQQKTEITGELLVSNGDEPLKRIYYGRVFNINPTKQFPDYISVFHCGEKIESNAMLNKTITGASRKIVDVIEELKKQMGIEDKIKWGSPEIEAKISGIPLEDGQYVGHGFARNQLDVLAADHYFSWNTNNNVLSIYDSGRYETPVSTDFTEITPLDDIYGNPVITGLLSTKLDLRIKLHPDLRAGDSIDIKNLDETHIDWQIGNVNAVEFIGKDKNMDITGLWRMHDVKHFGDTRDNQWETSIVAIQSRGENNGS